MVKLSDIVQIQTGVYLQPEEGGNAAYIQVKDVDDLGVLPRVMKPEVQLSDRQGHHILEQGDVLFAAKGDKNVASVFYPLALPAVASSAFFVLRGCTGVLPEFLAWFINLPINQMRLKAEAKGSSIPSISLKTLGELPIKMVTLEKQKLIIKIEQYRMREKYLLQELASLNNKLIEFHINSFLRNSL